jgi:hypothetical protein
MTNTEHDLRVCPTRIDGAPVLFAHRVDAVRCQERQRQRYHKCFTCSLNNSYVATYGEGKSPRRPAPSSATA